MTSPSTPRSRPITLPDGSLAVIHTGRGGKPHAHFLGHRRRPLAAAITAALLGLSAVQAAQADEGQGHAGGSAGERTGNGFGCASGTYQIANGIARCTLPSASTTPSASCAASVLVQDACTFNFPATTSGSTPSISTSTVGYSGAAQATCSHGAWGGLTATCNPNHCAGSAGSFGSCSFNVPPLASGTSAAVPTSTSGYTGSETASCTNGTVSESGQTCSPTPPPAPPCNAGTIGWDGTCSASIWATSSGSSATVSNTTAGYTGSATFGCAAGAWQVPTGATCDSVCGTEPATRQTLSCPAGQSGAGVAQVRTEACNTGTGWAWAAGSWTTTSSACTINSPKGLPSDTLVAGGAANLRCDDTVSATSTGTYTATSTWNRSPDGRGADLGQFTTKIVQKWSWDGLNWNQFGTPAYTAVNLGMNPAHYCL